MGQATVVDMNRLMVAFYSAAGANAVAGIKWANVPGKHGDINQISFTEMLPLGERPQYSDSHRVWVGRLENISCISEPPVNETEHWARIGFTLMSRENVPKQRGQMLTTPVLRFRSSLTENVLAPAGL